MRERQPLYRVGAWICLFALAGCTKQPDGQRSRDARPTLRVGISNVRQAATDQGIQQFVLNQTSEGLLRVNQEGRVESWLAEGWERSADGLRLSIRLRKPAPLFHDDTPADAPAVAAILNNQLTKSLKLTAADVESITADGPSDVVIRFRRPSSFFVETLMDAAIVKPGTPSVGVGAFKAAPPAGRADGAQIVANDQYYLGKPSLGALAFKNYANVRGAWADMLRDQLDMLYEVGAEAIATLQGSTNVSIYTFNRPYQYVVFLNPHSAKLRSPLIRQALNEAIDRNAFVRDALSGHGVPSYGPVSPNHWAFQAGGSTFTYSPNGASAALLKGLTITCFTIPETPFEQIALVLKQQLSNVGVNLLIEEASVEQISSKLQSPDFEAVLLDMISGWSVSRTSRFWHSSGPANATKFASAAVDGALDRINHSVSDDEYRSGVADFQRAIANDPPAIFLAWSDRSRAISNKFDVHAQPGRDVLATLRTWRLAADNRNATNN